MWHDYLTFGFHCHAYLSLKTSDEGDMSLHIKQSRKHIISIKNEQGISSLPH